MPFHLNTDQHTLNYHFSRVISGLSVGLGDSVVIIYIGEVSSKHTRGLYSAFDLSSFLSGILIEYLLTAFLDYTSATVVLIIFDAVTMISCFFLVESPYYQAASNEPALATKTISWLWNMSEEQAANKLSEINQSIEKTKNDRFFELIQKKPVYMSFIIATTYGIITSLINVTISSNANLILPSSNILSSDWFAIIFSSLSAIAIALSAIFIHNFGRKTLLSWSFTLEILFYAVIAALFFVDQKSIIYIRHFAWVIFTAIAVSHFIFQLGIYSTTTAVRSEIYPHTFKIIATNASIICNAATNFISTYSFMYFREEFGMYMNFITFLIASLVGLFITVCMLPETKDKTLEEIQRIMEGKGKLSGSTRMEKNSFTPTMQMETSEDFVRLPEILRPERTW